jgi:hypothetical protein
MNVRVSRITLSLSHSTILVMMSAQGGRFVKALLKVQHTLQSSLQPGNLHRLTIESVLSSQIMEKG